MLLDVVVVNGSSVVEVPGSLPKQAKQNTTHPRTTTPPMQHFGQDLFVFCSRELCSFAFLL